MSIGDFIYPTSDIAKMLLVNMATQENLTVQFNPTEFEEALGTEWARHVVPGNSHKRKHFINTNDVTYTFELFNEAANEGPAGYARILEARKFLYALCYPRKANSVIEGGVPRVLFVWPEIASVTCVVTSLKFKYTRFNKFGQPISWTSSVTLEEIRDVVITSDQIRTQGSQRTVTDLGDID